MACCGALHQWSRPTVCDEFGCEGLRKAAGGECADADDAVEHASQCARGTSEAIWAAHRRVRWRVYGLRCFGQPRWRVAVARWCWWRRRRVPCLSDTRVVAQVLIAIVQAHDLTVGGDSRA